MGPEKTTVSKITDQKTAQKRFKEPTASCHEVFIDKLLPLINFLTDVRSVWALFQKSLMLLSLLIQASKIFSAVYFFA
jgi:hypothetical protein